MPCKLFNCLLDNETSLLYHFMPLSMATRPPRSNPFGTAVCSSQLSSTGAFQLLAHHHYMLASLTYAIHLLLMQQSTSSHYVPFCHQLSNQVQLFYCSCCLSHRRQPYLFDATPAAILPPAGLLDIALSNGKPSQSRCFNKQPTWSSFMCPSPQPQQPWGPIMGTARRRTVQAKQQLTPSGETSP